MNASHSPQVTSEAAIAERAEQRLVAGTFVVEGEPVTVVADLDDAAVVLDPRAGVRSGRSRRRASGQGSAPYAGRRGLQDEHVLDVHHQQLLVLLLVVQAELDELGDDASASSPASRSVMAPSTCAR